MPVYHLLDDLIFPHPSLADPSGLLAVGGDLSVDRLLLAYANGIFPWYSEKDPIMWWSPDPRTILFPHKLKVAKSYRQTLRNKEYEIKFDEDFESIIKECAQTQRPGQPGTWITSDMIKAYAELHNQGYAHSVEVYMDHKLVGGLYGVSIGAAFFGESMFYKVRDASKIALWHLVEKIKEWDFKFIDAQMDTDHIKRLGAENIPRESFLNLLNEALKFPTVNGKW
ncbi:MAG: leucyl/phenylalanyl-tRNA--protein transferase [Bacteroidales bacterium]